MSKIISRCMTLSPFSSEMAVRSLPALRMYAPVAPETCLALPILCYFGPTDCNLPQFSRARGLEMVSRMRVPTKNVFLTANGVATRLAIRELKKANLLAKAGISLLAFGEEPKRVGAEGAATPLPSTHCPPIPVVAGGYSFPEQPRRPARIFAARVGDDIADDGVRVGYHSPP